MGIVLILAKNTCIFLSTTNPNDLKAIILGDSTVKSITFRSIENFFRVDGKPFANNQSKKKKQFSPSKQVPGDASSLT